MAQTTLRNDHEIHQAVIQELKWDTHVDETEIGVEVDKRIVTLTGTVSSYAKKIAAQEAAHRVEGVLDVANDIHVKVPGSVIHTDTDIAQAIRRVLEWDALVNADNIQSTVASGWVTLTGWVPSWVDRQYAERAVHNLSGVRGVTNNLTVSATPVDIKEVQNSIEDALKRRAERESDRIKVTIKDGAVVLTGRVHNWHEKQAVLGAAGYARGVHKVEDHLQIEPYF